MAVLQNNLPCHKHGSDRIISLLLLCCFVPFSNTAAPCNTLLLFKMKSWRKGSGSDFRSDHSCVKRKLNTRQTISPRTQRRGGESALVWHVPDQSQPLQSEICCQASPARNGASPEHSTADTRQRSPSLRDAAPTPYQSSYSAQWEEAEGEDGPAWTQWEILSAHSQ